MRLRDNSSGCISCGMRPPQLNGSHLAREQLTPSRISVNTGQTRNLVWFPAIERVWFPPHTDAQDQRMGIETSKEVPRPTGLVTLNCPPSASTLSVRPMSPDPLRGLAPPTPSSRIAMRR